MRSLTSWLDEAYKDGDVCLIWKFLLGGARQVCRIGACLPGWPVMMIPAWFFSSPLRFLQRRTPGRFGMNAERI